MPEAEPTAVAYAVAVPRRRFTAFLVLVVIVLLINHVMLQVLHYQCNAGHWVLRDLFDVDEEQNLPSWYASCSLLLCAGLLYAIASKKAAERDRFARHWLLLSIGFLLLSADEAAGLHEALNTVIVLPWTVPGAILVVLVGLAFLRFLIHLPARTRAAFVLAGALFVGGAIGVEHVTDWYLANHKTDSLGYNLLTAVEEGLEMFGVVLFIDTLLGYMAPRTVVVIPGVEQDDSS